MKTIALAAALAACLAVAAPAANAKGCIKGAAVGGVAGHVAHHHGLVGAGIGCLVGRHHANQKQAEQQQTAQRASR